MEGFWQMKGTGDGKVTHTLMTVKWHFQMHLTMVQIPAMYTIPSWLNNSWCCARHMLLKFCTTVPQPKGVLTIPWRLCEWNNHEACFNLCQNVQGTSKHCITCLCTSLVCDEGSLIHVKDSTCNKSVFWGFVIIRMEYVKNGDVVCCL